MVLSVVPKMTALAPSAQVGRPAVLRRVVEVRNGQHDDDVRRCRLFGRIQMVGRGAGLANVDAPEKSQPYGQRVRQSLSAICWNKSAEYEEQDTDRYSRKAGRLRRERIRNQS